jgi:hypothetical protein
MKKRSLSVKKITRLVKANPRTTFCLALVFMGIIYSVLLVIVRPVSHISESNCGILGQVIEEKEKLPFAYEYEIKNPEVTALSFLINGNDTLSLHTVTIERNGEKITDFETEKSINTVEFTENKLKKADVIKIVIDSKLAESERMSFCTDGETKQLQISEHYSTPRYTIYWYAIAFFVIPFVFWGLAREEDNEK